MLKKKEALLDDLLKGFEQIMSYWSNKGVDTEEGGFYGQVDCFGVPVAGAPKGAVLNARILWTFSMAYNSLKKEEYLGMAHRAYDYLLDHFWDTQYGGLFWSVTHDGKMLDPRKQIYAQGFGIYGLTEYFLASGKQESLDYAIALYRLIEQHSFDPKHQGYIEALSQQWLPLDDMRLSARDANEPKSMNTHLHIIEPYTNLYRAWPDSNLAEQIRGLIRVFLNHIIDQETGHLKLFFEIDWTVKGKMVSYGHDIEAAWLLCEAAETLGDPALLQEVEVVAVKMADVTLREGLASDGSLYYERDPDTGHLEKERHWWPQTEAMVGFTNAWQITGNDLYLRKMEAIWQFIGQKFIDREHGEWFSRLNEHGQPILSDPKIGFWKCPYHNSRALMEIYRRINR